MNAQDVVVTAVFLALGGWFLARNRKVLNTFAFIRHIVFIGFVWIGAMAFFHGGTIVRMVFGREIYKGESLETAATAVRLAACLLSFAAAAIVLGKDRAKQFKLYGETFGMKKPNPPK